MYKTMDEIKTVLKNHQIKIAQTAALLDKYASLHKEAKATYDRALSELVEITEQIVNPTPDLFSLTGENDSKPAGADGWQKIELKSIPGINEKTAEVLAENEPRLITLGDFTSWGKPFTEVKGIGPKTAEKLEDALEQFWKAHPEYTRSDLRLGIFRNILGDDFKNEIKALENHDPKIETLGEWADYSMLNPGGVAFDSITGISTKAAIKIRKLIDSWLDKNGYEIKIFDDACDYKVEEGC